MIFFWFWFLMRETVFGCGGNKEIKICLSLLENYHNSTGHCTVHVINWWTLATCCNCHQFSFKRAKRQ